MSDNELPFNLADFPFQTERYDMSSCAVETRGKTTYPYEGAAVWLAEIPTPMCITEGAAGLSSRDGRLQSEGLAKCRQGVAQLVAGHTLLDPATGEYYPQVWGNADAVGLWPAEAIFHVISLITTGEAPEDRPNGSTRGPRGTSTRKSTGQKTSA